MVPPSLSELIPMILNTGLTHLGSEASNYALIHPYTGILCNPKP